MNEKVSRPLYVIGMRIKNGEGGIRTRGTRKGHTGFRNRLDQPLRHLSVSEIITYTFDSVKLQEYSLEYKRG